MADQSAHGDAHAEAAGQTALEAFQRWTWLAGRAQQLALEFWSREATATDTVEGLPPSPLDPMGVWQTWQQAAIAAAAHPQALIAKQADYWQEGMKLWQSMAAAAGGADAQAAPVKDKRFASPAWTEHPAFDFLRQSYLLASRYILESVGALEGLDAQDKAKALFYAKQYVDALSPANFALTNPDVIKATIESNGENLIKGFEHMLDDLSRGRMKMVEEQAFEVGRNVAATPGKVVFQNRLFQLIHYQPATDTVFEVPLLIFPPWINKYYILDLTAEKSFIRWAVNQGLSVFVVSWKNADESLRDVILDDYVLDGELRAIDVVSDICSVDRVHTIGYCVAGTTLAVALALLAARKQARRVATATFFTAQVDFEHAGDLKLFVDDEQLETVGALSEGPGYLDGRYMATTFNLLRANDLIWNYVVNNYLLGKDYLPFDLLYWNSDATNVPAKWHQDYLRDLYRDNKLVRRGAIVVDGTPIDLTRVKTPSYVQAGREDHIAPAVSVFEITKHFKGPLRFVLAGSGHVAGVVNPPAQMKYQHWTNDNKVDSLDAFIAGATEHKGSWWPDWIRWLAPQSGERIAARMPGTHNRYPPLEDAPGTYVKARI